MLDKLRELQGEVKKLKGDNERLERKKGDYPNVLAGVFSDLVRLQEAAVAREAELKAGAERLRKIITRNVEIWDRYGVIHKSSQTYLYNKQAINQEDES